MNTDKFVKNLSEVNDAKQFGGKAQNLAKMIQADLPVPPGFAVGLGAFNAKGELFGWAKKRIEELLNKNVLYAVRSSALAEDAADTSWAGQFESFLNTEPKNVIERIEECHNSQKARARAYSGTKSHKKFDIAVVVQEMIHPTHAGVLFTKDPVTGADILVTEYVEGLGEKLVSGLADPKRITWSPNEEPKAPFNTKELTNLAQTVERVFESPQDIEWALDNKMWLVQARPITTDQRTRKGYYLGEPEDLFYWGPSRAKSMYMSDYIAAVEDFFIAMHTDSTMPNPPKTLALFYKNKVVWLINAKLFVDFVEKTFEAYEKRNKLNEDIANWQKVVTKLNKLPDKDLANSLIESWRHTLFAEFSLYGAESAISKRLERFKEPTRQEIWGAYTVPDKSTFLTRIDQELLTSKNPEDIGKKYPWIQDGYEGVLNNASAYFTQRLKILSEDLQGNLKPKKDRKRLASKHGLSGSEVKALTLARKLAEFMDDRKAWMMQTRRLIKKRIRDVEYGWFFDDGKVATINKDVAEELWQRYVDFKTSSSVIKGIVASNGGKHFINGEVAVISGPTDIVGNSKILVVPSTSPSYVPLMRKARALVTDHGGMMSHAAIVAREFGLPCIVGTKQATKILKSGDQVVLDLVKGEVNK